MKALGTMADLVDARHEQPELFRKKLALTGPIVHPGSPGQSVVFSTAGHTAHGWQEIAYQDSSALTIPDDPPFESEREKCLKAKAAAEELATA